MQQAANIIHAARDVPNGGGVVMIIVRVVSRFRRDRERPQPKPAIQHRQRGYARAMPDSTKPPRHFPPPWTVRPPRPSH
jgi:hypothetical protein